MKKNLLTVLTASALFGCAGNNAAQKTSLDDVIKIHDKVMAADEKLMLNKMKLDTLLKRTDGAVKDSAVILQTKLVMADSAMANWMHKFDPDFKGKSENEKASYLDNQKKQISAIDSQISAAIIQSDKYLLKVKSK